MVTLRGGWIDPAGVRGQTHAIAQNINAAEGLETGGRVGMGFRPARDLVHHSHQARETPQKLGLNNTQH
jgi:hypothetical protein